MVRHSATKVITNIPLSFSFATPTDGYWVHENRAIPSHIPMLGQTIYYWVLVIYNGGGYTMTDRTWSEPIGEFAQARTRGPQVVTLSSEMRYAI